MGIVWNPFNPTGIDFTGAGGGAGGPAERYTLAFNNTSDWTTPVVNIYAITILAGTHGKGVNPNIQVYELISGNYEAVTPQSIVVNSLGDVSIQVPQVPDLRFNGLVLII